MKKQKNEDAYGFHRTKIRAAMNSHYRDCVFTNQHIQGRNYVIRSSIIVDQFILSSFYISWVSISRNLFSS
ncbi:MAG: hypothetical protein KL787_03625 [Taibaiella sp.]|nr:hypothetical protein [Taibaiella sp.]